MPIPSLRVASVGTGLVIIGLGCAPIFPTMIHETPRLFGARYSQGIIGLEMAAAYVSASFCPAVFGILAQTFSFKFFFAAVSVFWLTMIFMLKKLGQLRRGSDLLNK
jgi:fucose permease